MPYCTTDDIDKKLSDGELLLMTDDDGTGQVDDAVITDAIADADAEIDSYCGKLYPVPFTAPIPAMLRKLSVDITIYNLFLNRSSVPEDRQKSYDDAIKFLGRVTTGSISLGTVTEEADPGGPVATKSRSDRIFTMESMGGF